FCRAWTERRLNPIGIHFAHRRLSESSELEKFFGCRVEYGADTDRIIFDKGARQLPLISADRYLNEIILHDCEQALAYRRSATGPPRIAVEKSNYSALAAWRGAARSCCADAWRKQPHVGAKTGRGTPELW